MKKSVTFVLAFILILSFVTAVGVSTRDRTKTTTDSTSNLENSNKTVICADITDRTERIKCRLDQSRLNNSYDDKYADDNASIPESCLNLGSYSREKCKEFYSQIRPCYRLDGVEKHSCFRRIAGLTKASLSGEAEKSRIKNYVIALLYDLQEKVENLSISGEINSSSAAETIELIVQIKEKLFESATKAEIKPMIQELKQNMWAIRNEN